MLRRKLLTTGAVLCCCAWGVESASAVELGVATEISWERLKLPSTHLAFRTVPGTTGVTPVTNHNGTVDGGRLDLSYGMASSAFGASTFGIKGFYGHESSKQNFACAAGSLAAGFCDVLPLFDSIPNPVPPNAQNTFGSANSGVTYVTDRRADHWGVALEFQAAARGNIFTTQPARTDATSPLFAPKGGIAFRQIGQKTTITATDTVFGTNINYNEKLDTAYSGAYLGLTTSQSLGAGVVISLDGEAGLYWAHTRYDGTMLSSSANAGNSTLSLSKDQAAIVGGLKAAIDKDFGNNWKLGLFTRAEWYSYAPEMNYNTFDRTGLVTAFSGPNDGTSIGNSSTWSWSAGARVSFKFN